MAGPTSWASTLPATSTFIGATAPEDGQPRAKDRQQLAGNAGHVFSPRDFTGDGKSDVMAVSRTTGNLYLYAGNGKGGWLRSGVNIGAGWQNLPTVFSPGDFTSDRRSDVMAVKQPGDLYLFRGNGAGGWLSSGQRIATGLS